MEEDEDTKPFTEDGETGSPLPAWAQPARRSDNIGNLAWRLRGDGPAQPDFSAAVPLVDAVADLYGAAHAMDLQQALCRALTAIRPHWFDSARGRVRMAESVRRHVCQACRPYLYDLASAFAVLGRLVATAAEPDAPLETRSASLDVVMARVPTGYGIGDRISLPDGRQGMMVTPRNVAGFAGVLPTDNNYPTAMQDDGADPSDDVL